MHLIKRLGIEFIKWLKVGRANNTIYRCSDSSPKKLHKESRAHKESLAHGSTGCLGKDAVELGLSCATCRMQRITLPSLLNSVLNCLNHLINSNNDFTTTI